MSRIKKGFLESSIRAPRMKPLILPMAGECVLREPLAICKFAGGVSSFH